MTTTIKRLAAGFGIHVLAVTLGAGLYAASQDEFPGRANRPFAQRGGPGGVRPFGGPGGPMGMLGLPPMIAERLGLTDAQTTQIRSIMDSRRDEVQALIDRSGTARSALETAVASGTFDEATIRARSAELAVIEADMAVTRGRIYAEVVQVLTPEQRTQLNTLQSEMQARRQAQVDRRANRTR